MTQDQLSKWVLWTTVVFAVASIIAFICFVVQAVYFPAHAAPVCWDENIKGTIYSHCNQNEAPKPTPHCPGCQAVQPRAEVPHDRVAVDHVAVPQVQQGVASRVPPMPDMPHPPALRGQLMPPRIFFTPGGPVVVQLPFGVFSFRFH